MKTCLSIVLFFALYFVCNSQNDYYNDICRNKKHVNKFAKQKVKIWIKINKNNYDFLRNIKIKNLKLAEIECGDNEYSDSTAFIGNIPYYEIEVLCYKNKKDANLLIFYFNIYGNFTEIGLYDEFRSSYMEISVFVNIREFPAPIK